MLNTGSPSLSKIIVFQKSASNSTLKAGAVVTGLMIVFGTGGGEDKQWEGLQKIIDRKRSIHR